MRRLREKGGKIPNRKMATSTPLVLSSPNSPWLGVKLDHPNTIGPITLDDFCDHFLHRINQLLVDPLGTRHNRPWCYPISSLHHQIHILQGPTIKKSSTSLWWSYVLEKQAFLKRLIYHKYKSSLITCSVFSSDINHIKYHQQAIGVSSGTSSTARWSKDMAGCQAADLHRENRQKWALSH